MKNPKNVGEGLNDAKFARKTHKGKSSSKKISSRHYNLSMNKQQMNMKKQDRSNRTGPPNQTRRRGEFGAEEI